MVDTIGEILWYAIFITPLIIVPIVWKYYTTKSKLARFVVGMLVSLLLSAILFLISMSIFMRGGLGPT
jgi:hypothetical protein